MILRRSSPALRHAPALFWRGALLAVTGLLLLLSVAGQAAASPPEPARPAVRALAGGVPARGLAMRLQARARGRAGAQPAEREQLVYDVQAFDGSTYGDAFYPQDRTTLYLLVGAPSPVVVARTRVYYWALQNKELPDWAALNQPVTGTLELTGADGHTQVVHPQPYILWFPQGGQTAPVQLLAGRDALAVYTAYLQDQQAYQAAQQAYTAQHQRFENQLAAYIAAVARLRRQGKPITGLRQPHVPVAPVAPVAEATAPSLAYLLDLKAGSYTLRVRGINGRLVPGAARTVVAITSRRRGIGYSVIPENRWTSPVALDGGATLYTPGSAVLYVQPFAAAEYDAQQYALLHEPQTTNVPPGQWTWAHELDKPLPTALRLAYRSMAAGQPEVETRVAFAPYYVQQTSGTALGYTVQPYSADRFPGQPPSFEGYRVPIGADGAVPFRLVDAHGRAVAGSAAEIRVAHPGAGRALFAPALLPVLLGLGLLLWRDLRAHQGKGKGEAP